MRTKLISMISMIISMINNKSNSMLQCVVKGRSTFRAKAAATRDDFQGYAGEGGRQNESANSRGT